MSEPVPVIPTDVSWPLRTVREMTTILRRGTAPLYVDDSDVMAIGQRCVTDAEFDGSRSRPHSATAMTKVVTPEVGDVLINSTGTGTIGRSVIFRDETSRYIVDGHVTVARPRHTDLVGRWLNDVLRSPAGQRYLESRCYAGSTNQIELSSSALASMPIAVPGITEQRRVALVLDTLDDQITALALIVEKLEKCRSGYVTDSLQRDDVQRIAPLGTLADVGAGVTLGSEPHGPGTVSRPYLRVANVQDGRLDLSDVKTVRVKRSDLYRFELQPGDVLMNEGGDADKLGRGAVWEGQILGCLHQNHVFRVRCRLPELDPRYLSTVTGSGIGKRYFLAASKQTTNLATINSQQIKQFPVPLRSIERQLQIVDTVGAFTARIKLERDELVKLQSFKRGLVQDLLSGRVRVPEGDLS
jgi:type I restriction enzyme S subunit